MLNSPPNSRALTTLFARPVPAPGPLPLFSVEGHRLTRFGPPFRFTSVFVPEDTLLCVLAAETALVRALARGDADGPRRGAWPRIVQLTAGSGLVGFRMLDAAPDATLLGIDVEVAAPAVAARNATVLGFADRARFLQMSVWSGTLPRVLEGESPDLLVCSPPCVPEPPDATTTEEGGGADGAAQLRRVLALAERVQPEAMAVAFSSLADPVGVVREAERIGYGVDGLFIVVVADGEHAGAAHDHLRSLRTAYLSESAETIAAIAPDGAARFAYLLMAAAFSRRTPVGGERVLGGERPPWAEGVGEVAALPSDRQFGAVDQFGVVERERASAAIERLLEDFAARGLPALEGLALPCPVSCWLLDRWDEIALRVIVHGPRVRPVSSPVSVLKPVF